MDGARRRPTGLKRTGKSCRLRWVNYLHPGLKRGRITPEEEKLILQLHGQWGSRWSRIARSLPGRTDNEIKNFWRTHTRKMAHHLAPDSASASASAAAAKKTKTAATTSSSSSSSSALTATTSCSGSTTNKGTTTTTTTTTSAVTTSADVHGEDEAVDQEATTTAAPAARQNQQHQHQLQDYTMDQLWNDIAAADAASYTESWGAAPAPAMMAASPMWEPCADYTLWKIDDEEYYKKMLDAS